jgi:hypothetical protein
VSKCSDCSLLTVLERRVETEGSKKKMVTVEVKMDLRCEQQQEVTEVSSEEETSLFK